VQSEGREKLREVIFERLIAGEDEKELRVQLSSRMSANETDQLIAEARQRIAHQREDPKFAREAVKIRKRRLIGSKYLPWKVIAWVIITINIPVILECIISRNFFIGNFSGVIFGSIILIAIGLREDSIVEDRDTDATGD